MLTTELERELREFWCGYESAIGFRSTFSAMIAAHQGIALGSGPPAGWDPYAEVIDRLSSGRRLYRALRRLGTADVVVLWRLYGPRNPQRDVPSLGDLSPLAELTTAAQGAREAIVLRESTRRSDGVGPRTAAALARRREELVEMFWIEVTEIRRVEERAPRVRSDRRLAELQARVDAGWKLLGQLNDAIQYDGTIRAQVGAIEGTDREVTVGDAVRARAKDKAFVDEVKREAGAMRERALSAYRAARAAEREVDRERRRERAQRELAETDRLLSGAA